MRRLFVGSLIGVLSLAASASAGEHEWYVGIEGGVELSGEYTSAYSETDYGPAVLATVGRRLGNITLEGELGYRSSDQDGVDIEQTSLMVNAIYEVPVLEQVSLSLGAGIGLDRVEYRIVDLFLVAPIEADEVQSAVQLKLGLNFELSEAADVYANYRVMTTLENEFASVDNSTLTVGLRFDF